MNRIRARLTYANVMSTIAVFLVVAGASAFAASHIGKNTVGGKQLKKNSVSAAKIKKNAVTETKIADAAVTTGKIADNAVTTGKIANNAVTTTKLADDAATGAKVKESSLRFTCNFPTATPAFQLPGGGLCAFVSGGAAAWATSINVCRGAATGGTLPTAAEFSAIAAINGSPFRGITAWTSDIFGGGTPTGAIVTTDGGGTISSISQTDLTLAPTTTTACVYDPALAPAPGA